MPNWRVDWGHESVFYGNEEIATFVASVDRGVGYIDDFRLSDQKYFGKGYGKLALRALEQRMRSSGARRVVLNDVLDESEGFWKKMGYKWPEGESVEDEAWDSRMCKTLRKLTG